jgi:hypothetical protein
MKRIKDGLGLLGSSFKNCYSLRLLLSVLIQMYPNTFMCLDIFVLGYVIVVGGSKFFPERSGKC